ncbi:GDP-mannose pyrophosphorylase [Novymonas esmeraldas]|uniref:mannose-1-phosphate guanylyltransferase n=1 Tax=Novymonas esmeraldas TaxID=1808958 RepID=A0AAW0EZ69_9TRYP
MSASEGQGMRAVILVGGFGTRLRPLTLTAPKPLVPFCNKPMIIHQIEALKAVGVTEVILAVAYRPEAMKAEMDEWSRKLGVSFVFSVEEEPLGTAGPLSLARDILLQDDKPFFVLNSDVTCSFPMQQLLDFHTAHGREGTIMVSQVTQWDKYGVVVYSPENNQIERFVEKPKEFVGDRINAGIYIFNKSILSRIPPRRTSIEKEIFPAMAADKQLYAFPLEGFWMDIGQPKDYIAGMSQYIPSLVSHSSHTEQLYTEARQKAEGSRFTIVGAALIDPSATIGDGAVIGPNATIGANCVIGEACRIDNAAILQNSKVGKGTVVSRSIIGWGNRIGSWCHIDDISVLGDDVEVKDRIVLVGTKVLPNKDVGEHHFEPTIIM